MRMNKYSIGVNNVEYFISNIIPGFDDGELRSSISDFTYLEYGNNSIYLTGALPDKRRVFKVVVEALEAHQRHIKGNVVSFTEARSRWDGTRDDVKSKGSSKFMDKSAHERNKQVAIERLETNKGIVSSIIRKSK